ncbi:hypothetical protein NMY22_g3633 [Coprinellus aureogranulatus]|nr:hypothetical protein NMY22_g3633 [Coprinellus aureogranulatus]
MRCPALPSPLSALNRSPQSACLVPSPHFPLCFEVRSVSVLSSTFQFSRRKASRNDDELASSALNGEQQIISRPGNDYLPLVPGLSLALSQLPHHTRVLLYAALPLPPVFTALELAREARMARVYRSEGNCVVVVNLVECVEERPGGSRRPRHRGGRCWLREGLGNKGRTGVGGCKTIEIGAGVASVPLQISITSPPRAITELRVHSALGSGEVVSRVHTVTVIAGVTLGTWTVYLSSESDRAGRSVDGKRELGGGRALKGRIVLSLGDVRISISFILLQDVLHDFPFTEVANARAWATKSLSYPANPLSNFDGVLATRVPRERKTSTMTVEAMLSRVLGDPLVSLKLYWSSISSISLKNVETGLFVNAIYAAGAQALAGERCRSPLPDAQLKYLPEVCGKYAVLVSEMEKVQEMDKKLLVVMKSAGCGFDPSLDMASLGSIRFRLLG